MYKEIKPSENIHEEEKEKAIKSTIERNIKKWKRTQKDKKQKVSNINKQ